MSCIGDGGTFKDCVQKESVVIACGGENAVFF